MSEKLRGSNKVSGDVLI